MYQKYDIATREAINNENIKTVNAFRGVPKGQTVTLTLKIIDHSDNSLIKDMEIDIRVTRFAFRPQVYTVNFKRMMSSGELKDERVDFERLSEVKGTLKSWFAEY